MRSDDLAELEQEILDEVTEIDERWRAAATDVRILESRLVWVPSA